MQTVSTEICELKHEHIDQAFLEDRQRLKSHGEQLDALSRLAAQQTSVIEGMAQRMEDLDARLKALEKKPQRRLERVMDAVCQWAALLMLGLVAAKIGLG